MKHIRQGHTPLHAIWHECRFLLPMLAAFGVLLLAAAQVPQYYSIAVGQEDGYGGDLPLVYDFYPPEETPLGAFRWTGGESTIRLDGFGQQDVLVLVETLPLPPVIVENGPQVLEFWAGGEKLAEAPVITAGGVYRVVLPATSSGNPSLTLKSATFQPPGDERIIGVSVTHVVAERSGWAWPAWGGLFGWLAAAALWWAALRLCGFGTTGAQVGVALAASSLALASALDPVRAALGVRPALQTLVLLLVLLAVLRRAAPALAARLQIPLDAEALRVLLVLAALVFGLRYGGKIYPYSMPGDIGFHSNRMADTVRGVVLLLSRNRGVDFPYPSGPYLILAPFLLITQDRAIPLRIAAGVADAICPLLVYALVVSGWQRSRVPARPVALGAAAVYSLTAAGFMTSWWNFSTHIFTQVAHLLLITALMVWWRRSETGAAGELRWFAALTLMQLLVYLGHFGFWMNTSLLFAQLGVVLCVAAWRGLVPWRRVRLLAGTVVLAELLTALLFYSGYTGLFLEQLAATSAGGLNGLAGREPVPGSILWQTLWDAGFRVHFGLVPVPVMLAVVVLDLWQRRRGAALLGNGWLAALMCATLLIALLFGSLPFLTGSTLSTRWLMFSAWVVAVGASAGAWLLWQRGMAGRLAVVLSAGYILLVMGIQWVGALAWRIRPPEPF